ncbi:DUF6396 domain-containing protein [Pseudomonas sp. dw_358]|uniref:SEL1-like repeat protein n=1 Tax=Pseudomonas sp. dw_358 TaxID=2720083 RepID=UPI0031F6CFB3
MLKVLFCVALGACQVKEGLPGREVKEVAALNDIEKKWGFSCSYEKIPAPEAAPDTLFKYARWLQKNNQLTQDDAIDREVERLYRVASEHAHYKATINLQRGALYGHWALSGAEHLRLSQRLIDAHVATGYYWVGTFLEKGLAGLRQDPEMALRYFRKAADEGSPHAQAFLGEQLAPVSVAPEVALQLRQCAARQGHGDAATMLGISLKYRARYEEALVAFQMGVAAGDETSAGFLQAGFRAPPKTKTLNYLGQQKDTERADRYQKILRILANYSYADPKVPEINDIVPLPPAPLPEWDGKLQWLEERLANIPPEKPSEELIKRLADEKLLEPATGKPMPGSASFDASGFPLKACYSGDVCPQTGYWQIMWLPYEARHQVDLRVTRHFKEGEVMPTHVAERYIVRHWPFSDKRTFTEQVVHWGLLG